MTDTQVAERPHPMIVFRNRLEERAAEFKTALPAHIPVEKFIRVITTAAQINPDIVACEWPSLRNACMRAAADGLMPDGVEGAIVPYKNKAVWIPMYQGLLKLFRNSGQFRHVNAGIVYHGEEFHHWVDENGEHFRHVPGDERDPSKVRRVYATATTKDGAFFIADMSLAEVNKHKAASRASREDAPWRQWEEAMQKKTALRVLSKLLPKSSDLEAAMQRDEESALGIERPLELVRSEADRPETAGATLDAFAEPPSRPQEAAAEPAHSENRPAGEDDIDTLQLAYQRGHDAKHSGQTKKAMPGEYRELDPASQKLATAWQCGFDGKPLPE
jgi:recombination protein RecT